MTTEHKDLDYLKGRFEDGDRPTGDDFARLIDSCHNTRQLTDVTITQALSVQGGLTVNGDINTRDVAADGAKLDSLDSFVRNNSDSWEETADIQSVTTQLQTASGTLSDSINNVSVTLTERIDDNSTTINTRVDDLEQSLTTHVDTNIQTLTNTVDTNNTNINDLVANNHGEINTRVDGLATGLGDTQSAVNEVTTTVFDNSASWVVDENTNSLHNLLDVEIGTINHSDVLKFDANDGVWRPATDLHGEGQHVDTFLELHDTAVAYTGTGKFVKINETNDGLAFVEHASDDWDNVRSTVKAFSGEWQDAFDWGDHATANYLTDYTVTQADVVAHQSAIQITESQISDLGTYLTDYTVTQADVVAHQSALSITESQISDLGTYLTDYTVTQADVTNHQSALSVTESQISDLGSYLVQDDINELQNDVTGLQNHITEVHNVSGNWALLDSNGILHVDQIPELSITQTYTVQNPEEVATLNPAEGIQRGDIVIVTSSYDNLVAKQDNPAGTYNSSTKAYSGYSKLARPDAYVTSVNEMYGNVTITSDNISDVDNTNKWTTQDNHDHWNAKLDSAGGTMSGNLDTEAVYLSGGTPLHEIFSTSNTIIGDMSVDGNISASSVEAVHKSSDGQTGITKNVNVGGNILHIVDGIIVGITDEA